MQRYFARDQTLTYPLCTMTVTVYHTTFNPFECRRAVLEGVHYETPVSYTHLTLPTKA